MKRKLNDSKDERATPPIPGSESYRVPSFALPFLAPPVTDNINNNIVNNNNNNGGLVVPAFGRTQSLTFANGILQPLPPSPKARKIEFAAAASPPRKPQQPQQQTQPVSPPPRSPPPRPKPKPIASIKRPLQALQPKLDASSSPQQQLFAATAGARFHPALSQHTQQQTTATLPPVPNTMMWPHPSASSPEALAQLEMIASCLTPLGPSPTTSQASGSPQMPPAMHALNPYALNGSHYHLTHYISLLSN